MHVLLNHNNVCLRISYCNRETDPPARAHKHNSSHTKILLLERECMSCRVSPAHEIGFLLASGIAGGICM